jgi:hypothetical protein
MAAARAPSAPPWRGRRTKATSRFLSQIVFESTVERVILDWKVRFRLKSVHVDPWQLLAVAQKLRRAGVNAVEYPQTLGNLSAMASNVFELVRSRALVLYPDPDLRRACAQSIVTESARGWRISKEKQSHKIDALIALAMASIAAVEGRGSVGPAYLFDMSSGELLTPRRFTGVPVGDLLAATKPVDDIPALAPIGAVKPSANLRSGGISRA